MNHQQNQEILPIVATLCEAANIIVSDGLCTAREDDPHRFQTLHREFDQGLARRRMVVDFLPGGQLRIATELHGLQGGQPYAVEVSALTVQGPVESREAH